MSRMFGTDGVRGVANEELTPLLAMQLGQAGAYILTRENKHKPTIMVGCDTRISGDMLANALMAGICSVGANAVYVGVIPTPAIAYLTKKYKVEAGVVISASHNPMEFNGIKFFDGNGYKLPDALEDEIEELIKNGMTGVEFPNGSGVGKVKGCQGGIYQSCGSDRSGGSDRHEDRGGLRGRSRPLYFCRGASSAGGGGCSDPQHARWDEYQRELRFHSYG